MSLAARHVPGKKKPRRSEAVGTALIVFVRLSDHRRIVVLLILVVLSSILGSSFSSSFGCRGGIVASLSLSRLTLRLSCSLGLAIQHASIASFLCQDVTGDSCRRFGVGPLALSGFVWLSL